MDAIHKKIPGAVFDGVAWTVPCAVKTSISLSIGGRDFSIDPRDLAFLPVDPDNPESNCTSGFSSFGPENASATGWLVRIVFLPLFGKLVTSR